MDSTYQTNYTPTNWEDKSIQETIWQIFIDMDLCGCGSPDYYSIIHGMLEHAAASRSFYDPIPSLSLNALTTEFIAHVMNTDKFDLLDHGTSVGHSWLTDKGILLLDFFRTFGTDNNKWPEFWMAKDVSQSCDKLKECS